MRRDSPLAEKEVIRPEDLWDKPLIVSHQKGDDAYLNQWLQREESELHIVATYNLIFNASLLVDEGLGYALCYDKLINTRGSNLCFRPVSPRLEARGFIVWKNIRYFPKLQVSFCRICGSRWKRKINILFQMTAASGCGRIVPAKTLEKAKKKLYANGSSIHIEFSYS